MSAPAEGETGRRSPPLVEGLTAAADILARVAAGQAADAVLAGLTFAKSGGHAPASSVRGHAFELRPLVRDLAWRALRRYGRDAFFLRRLLARPLTAPQVQALLCVALARLEELPGEAHTTVDQAVHAAARLDGGRYKGLVNGVLRNFLRRRDELLAAVGDDAEARWQHPRWWIERLQQDWPDHWPAILAAGNGRPPMTLRVNRRRTTLAGMLARLAVAGIDAEPLDELAIHLPKPVPVARLPGFIEGEVSVQDHGAQQAARLLDVRDGMRVLDACAAPGGKSAQLLETADIALLALDIDADRVRSIGENLRRLGLSATVKLADCRRADEWWDGRPFDRILLDAPCSASGVVRRHPDVKWLRRPGDVAALATKQRQMFEALWPLLAPGGKMLYCTCSLFAPEDGEQTSGFLATHPDARQIEGLALLPTDRHDGFFHALLEKTAIRP